MLPFLCQYTFELLVIWDISYFHISHVMTLLEYGKFHLISRGTTILWRSHCLMPEEVIELLHGSSCSISGVAGKLMEVSSRRRNQFTTLTLGQA